MTTLQKIDVLFVLEQIKKVFKGKDGLCIYAYDLQNNGTISGEQYILARKYLDDNVPKRGSLLYSKYQLKSMFWFPPKEKWRRRWWLRYHIWKLYREIGKEEINLLMKSEI